MAFGSGARVLDQCCGTGFYSLALARHGYQVTGVDLHPELLERANSACAGAGVAASFVATDIRHFAPPSAFDVVVNMYTSFGYFDDPDDNLLALCNAHTSLVPGGRVLVDLLSKEVYASWVGPPKVVDVPGGMVVMRDEVLDDWTRYRTDWTLVRGDQVARTSLTCFVYSAVEMRHLLEQAGFDRVECFGGFDGRPYDGAAQRLIVRATKA